eukprot:SAG22_NODE_2153_length_2923_cov_2.212819_2_plen_62_part_00
MSDLLGDQQRARNALIKEVYGEILVGMPDEMDEMDKETACRTEPSRGGRGRTGAPAQWGSR